MTRAATWLTAVVVTAGPPLLAGLWLADRPWPALNAASIQDWLQQPRTLADMLTSVVVVAALLWTLIAGYILRRTLTSMNLRWRRVRHLQLPTPAQMTASSMAGVAALTLPAVIADHAIAVPTTTAPPADPTATTQTSASAQDAAQAGIALPGGGWLPYRTAVAIASLSTIVLINRRRTYRPDPRRIGTHNRDADLQPLSPVTQSVTAALDTEDSARTDPIAPDLLPTGLLHLHGPGVSDATRALLVSTAVHAATNPATTSCLQLHHGDASRLLPHLDLQTPLPGIRFVDESTRRDDNPPGREPTTIVLHGASAARTSWHVAVDGTTTGPGLPVPQRFGLLDAHAATDLLTLVQQRHARTGRRPAPRPHSPAPTAIAAPLPPVARLTLLGDCTLTVNGQHLRLRRSAALQILAYLAIHPTGATRSELITAIWPHLPPATITQRLHTTLSDLRSQLRPAIDDPVIWHDDRYQLSTAISSDLHEWHSTAALTTTAIGAIARADACRRLLRLHQGELAAGRSWPWIVPAREAIRRDALDACLALADHSTPAEARTWLKTAQTIDPYNTRVQELLVRPGGVDDA